MLKFHLLIFLLLAACSSPRAVRDQHLRTSERFHIPSTERFFVDGQGPFAATFNAAVQAALAGDDAQLVYVLSLSRFSDGEGALNYGGYLIDLRAAVGSSRFDRTLKSLGRAEQERVWGFMESADEIRRRLRETR